MRGSSACTTKSLGPSVRPPPSPPLPPLVALALEGGRTEQSGLFESRPSDRSSRKASQEQPRGLVFSLENFYNFCIGCATLELTQNLQHICNQLWNTRIWRGILCHEGHKSWVLLKLSSPVFSCILPIKGKIPLKYLYTTFIYPVYKAEIRSNCIKHV